MFDRPTLSDYQRRYRDDPAFREQERERQRGRMRRLRALPEFQESERERLRLRQRRRRAEHDPGWLAQKSARRAREKGATKHENVDREKVYEREGGRCHICGRRVSRAHFTLDHLVPLIRGGEHTYANVRIAHGRCNSRMHVAALPAQLVLVDSPQEEAA